MIELGRIGYPDNCRVFEVDEYTRIEPGVQLLLMPGDYIYSDDWWTPKPVHLEVTHIGDCFVLTGRRYLYVEGFQLMAYGPNRRRGLGVLVDVLRLSVID